MGAEGGAAVLLIRRSWQLLLVAYPRVSVGDKERDVKEEGGDRRGWLLLHQPSRKDRSVSGSRAMAAGVFCEEQRRTATAQTVQKVPGARAQGNRWVQVHADEPGQSKTRAPVSADVAGVAAVAAALESAASSCQCQWMFCPAGQ